MAGDSRVACRSEWLPHFVYLKIAERDLEAAKCLLKNESYPQAVLLVAQSVEKAVKSMGLWNRSITLAEAKRFAHKTYDLYARVFERLLAFAKSHPEDTEIQLKINGFEEYSKRVLGRLSREDGMRLSRQLLLLSGILDKVELLYAASSTESRIVDSHLDRLHDPGFSANRTQEGRILKSRKRLDRLVFCHTCLLQMCRIFIPHTSRARYPESGWNPLQFYTSELPLIRLLGDFIELQQKALKTVRDIYDEIPVFPGPKDDSLR